MSTVNIGEKFGHWVATSGYDGPWNGRVLCTCVCGSSRTVALDSLRKGTSTSCGCMAHSKRRATTETHGHTKGRKFTKLYRCWLSMKARCNCSATESYENYGGRGIRVCDSWNSSFEAFASDMGNPPSDLHSIDRLDVDGPYEPNNCRWSTPLEQANNKRNSRKLLINGRSLTLSQWGREVGVDPETIAARLGRGLPEVDAVYAPIRKACSGISGIGWDSSRGRWRAQSPMVNGRSKSIGRFDTLLDAASAVLGNLSRGIR